MADSCDSFGCTDAMTNNVVSFRMRVLQYLCQILAQGVSRVLASTVQTEAVIDVNDASTVVLATNLDRKGGWVKNISDTDIYVSFSTSADTTKPTLLEPGNSLVLGLAGGVTYQGPVSAIHAAAGLQKQLEVVEF